MFFELIFTFKERSNIQGLMNAFHEQFAGKGLSKYVFDTGKSYLLLVHNVGRTVLDPSEVVVLFQDEGQSWRARVAPESNWDEQASFSIPGRALVESITKFFTERCNGLINVTRTLASPKEETRGQEEERMAGCDESETVPFESEISKDGTLVRCPNCGSAEIVFPDRHTCSRCGTDVLKRNNNSARIAFGQSTTVSNVRAQSETETLGKCMVCGSGIHKGESLLTCIHCSGTAHRTHLLEYVHVKGRCPACGARLSEGDLVPSLPVIGRTQKARK
jgi:ribosomal protein S27E